jgi:hypothetical protein
MRSRTSARRSEMDISRSGPLEAFESFGSFNGPNVSNDPNGYFFSMPWSAGSAAFTSAAFSPSGATFM